ncbi:rhomboid family intramembrane serine protease [Aliicoccus persicus]|uniref:Rhomboid protease GluP n=1 Tax=Aliicoccus persicus TaxID=930138 RepID=A0A662Z1D6_9STAP|nr:rhomboid family intramembrane serine protease [Aliicoccus persicus]SEV86106.1 rhomboid protease GluP [Aliicoccus persicus]
MLTVDSNLKEAIKKFPGTLVIILLILIHSLLVLVIFGEYNKESIYILGGLHKDVISNGELWRLITFSISHMSVFHVILNLPIIYLLARPIEKYYGTFQFLSITVILSIITGITILVFYTGTYPLAGSSGIGYGFLGALLYFSHLHPNKFRRKDRQFLNFVLIFGIIFTITVPDISIAGHLGGLLIGSLVGFISKYIYKSKETFILD